MQNENTMTCQNEAFNFLLLLLVNDLFKTEQSFTRKKVELFFFVCGLLGCNPNGNDLIYNFNLPIDFKI